MTYDMIDDAQTIVGNTGGRLLANRYRVVRQLGQGGMGSVWLAEDTQLDNKPFAIKMLPSILVSNKRAYRQLKDEALVAMKLTHPNIVTLRAFEENDGNPFLVMDYVDGQTLDDYLAEHNGTTGISPVGGGSTGTTGVSPVATGLSEAEVLRILRPIAAALDYAHAKGIVHRDVKPGNVMIAKDGTPYILDFGIAREIQETMTRVTGKLSSGTLLYMSPEQLRGHSPKPAQDIYSFAAMAYECLKGEPPFSRGQIEFQILSEPPESLVGLAAISAPLAASIMAGLAKNPDDRPPSCATVLEGKGLSRVEHVERVETVGARVPRARTDGGAFKMFLAIAALALAVAGGWWYYRQEQVREQARIAAEAERQKAATEEAKRKAEEAARQKVAAEEARRQRVAEEEAKRKADEAARQKAAEEAKRKAEEAARLAAERREATEIRIEAKVSQAKLARLSDADGFKMRKDSLEETFTRAEALFDEKVKRWAEAAQGFSNYVMRAGDLVKLDGERQSASKSRTQAQEAFRSAEAAGAKTYAMTRWNAAVEIWNRADAEFGRMEFSVAGGTFASAAKQFETCIGEAKNEKERREAEARERAEKEARERERRAKWRKYGEEFTINDPYGLYMTMKWCPAGSFTMGSPGSEEGRYDEETQHQVTLTKGFWMGETEVTQGQWKKIMNGVTVLDLARKGLQDDTSYYIGDKHQTLREFWGLDRDGDPKVRCGELNDDVPVYNVSWHEAVEFCRRLTQRERAEGRIPDGYEYRLPTEAEWEYACRARTTESLPNGRDIRIIGKHNAPALDNIAWYGGNSSVGFNGWGWDTSNWAEKQYPGGRASSREVKGKQPNNWGLYDMIGNVWEWCGDWRGDYPYGSVTDPTSASSGTFRIARGGCWDSDARRCRSAARGNEEPGYRGCNVGFRVALAPSH